MQKVPQAGYQIEGLWISGIQRRLTADNLAFPIKVAKSLLDASRIIKRFQPDIAIGTGGYASGPLLFAAARKELPTVIQEQNSYAGITNKLLSKKADKICVASDGMEKFFPKEKIVKTGNPVRQDLFEISELRNQAYCEYNLDPSKKTLLVIGGSLGARRINELIEQNLNTLTDDVQLIWQCGKTHYQKFKNHESRNVRVLEYVERMDLAYATADFIISRAGAGSISELCIVGKPVILIPSPHVAENHQVKNAETISSKDAAIMIEEKNLEDVFQNAWSKLISDAELRDKLSDNIKSLALPNATKDIVDIIEKLIHD